MVQERYNSTYSLLWTTGIHISVALPSNQDIVGPQTMLRCFGAEEILFILSGIELIGCYYVWTVTLGQVLKLFH